MGSTYKHLGGKKMIIYKERKNTPEGKKEKAPDAS